MMERMKERRTEEGKGANSISSVWFLGLGSSLALLPQTIADASRRIKVRIF